MRIRPFEFVRPAGLAEAVTALNDLPPGTVALAGGTDLVPALKHKTIRPPAVVDLSAIEELDSVREDGDLISLGALRRHQDVAEDQTIEARLPVLARASGLVGSWQIRQTGTIGGNICNASPAADTAGPLLALEARLVLVGPDGEEEMAAADFFTGPGETRLGSGRLLKEIIIAPSQGKAAGRYLKLMRKQAVDLALIGVTVQLEANADGTAIGRPAIALGGVAPTPIRAQAAEQLLVGLGRDEALGKINQVIEAATEAAKPIDDIRATADYRREMLAVYLRRGLTQTLAELFN